MDKFEPYGSELVRPLAVWFNGSSIIIGSDAKREAQKGTSNAFSGLFELMKQQNHFDYASEKHDYNKLILYTIRSGLKEFFIEQMLNTKGDLDNNIGHLPLLLILQPDIETNEKMILVNQLRDNGFGIIKDVNEDKYIISELSGNRSGLVLILSSNGDDLNGTIYKGEEFKDTFSYKNAGQDPRVNHLARIIWDRTQAENDWLNYDDEKSELCIAATKFIESGDAEMNDVLTLSNGTEYNYYLTKDDLKIHENSEAIHIVREIIDRVDQYGNIRECLVVLNNKAANNKYLQDILKPEFASMQIMDRSNKNIVYDKILQDCKITNFVFKQPRIAEPRPCPPTMPIKVGTRVKPSKPSTQIQEPISNIQTVASPRDKRDYKVLLKSFETYIRNMDEKGAKDEALTFLDSMHKKGVNEFDEEISEWLEKIHTNCLIQPKKESVQPTPKDKHLFKIIKAQFETYKNNGKIGDIKDDIKKIKQDMTDKGSTFFDSELANMLASAAKIVPGVKPKVIKEKGNKEKGGDSLLVSEGKTLMKQGKFKEAREKFRQINDMALADDCTTIIRWQRFVPLYESEVESTKQNKNITKAKARTKDIQANIILYKKYGIDTSALDALLKQYKLIK